MLHMVISSLIGIEYDTSMIISHCITSYICNYCREFIWINWNYQKLVCETVLISSYVFSEPWHGCLFEIRNILGTVSYINQHWYFLVGTARPYFKKIKMLGLLRKYALFYFGVLRHNQSIIAYKIFTRYFWDARSKLYHQNVVNRPFYSLPKISSLKASSSDTYWIWMWA